MSAWADLDRVAVRAGAFFAVLALPFLRHLLRLEYPWWRSEVVVLLVVFALPACALAALTARRTWFLPVFVLWLALASASAVNSAWYGVEEWVPLARWSAIFAALVVVFGALAVMAQRRLVGLTLVLLSGMLAAEAALAATAKVRAWASPETSASASATAATPLVIHVVFDGQIGLAGFPEHLPEAAAASRAWRDTLLRHGFTVYPHAFSNYEHTRNSVPSILNDRLMGEAYELIGHDGIVTENQRFEAARARGLSLAVYQSDFIRVAVPGRETSVREYAAIAPAPMSSELATLAERTEVLAGWYARLDKVGTAVLKGVSPFALFSPNQSPLNVRRVWPDMLRLAVHAAARPTYFFAHVLLPHPPFALDADGRVRMRRLWRLPVRHTPDRNGYDQLYREYADQSRFVAKQLDALLDEFERTGVLARADVLLHGDHGSRVHALADVTDSLADLSNTPDHVRGLIDSYSTLLAVRRAGPGQARVDDTTGGILRLLRRIDGRPEGPEAEAFDRVYRYQDGRREPTSVVMRDYWKD